MHRFVLSLFASILPVAPRGVVLPLRARPHVVPNSTAARAQHAAPSSALHGIPEFALSVAFPDSLDVLGAVVLSHGMARAQNAQAGGAVGALPEGLAGF